MVNLIPPCCRRRLECCYDMQRFRHGSPIFLARSKMRNSLSLLIIDKIVHWNRTAIVRVTHAKFFLRSPFWSRYRQNRALDDTNSNMRTKIITPEKDRQKVPTRYVIHGTNGTCAQMLEVSQLGVGKVFRLERDAWSMVT